MDQDKMNDLERNLPPLGTDSDPMPVDDFDLDDLLGPELMAILNRKDDEPRISVAPEVVPEAVPDVIPEPKRPERAPRQPAQPEPQPEAQPVEEEPLIVVKRRPRKKRASQGTKIFYTVYVGLVIIAVAALLAVTIPLHNWLVRYEASQPEQQGEKVFTTIFAQPDWAVIYQLAEVQDTTFEGQDAYVKYMQAKVAAAKNPNLTYMETSAGLSGDRKYIVKLDDEKVATFTLESSTGPDAQTTNWKLGVVEVFFQRTQSVTVQKIPGYVVFVNGVPLDDSYTIRSISTKAEEYLPAGVHGYQLQEQYVSDLLNHPDSVVVRDSSGTEVQTTYDAATNTYTIPMPIPAEMTGEERQLALDAAEANALYAIQAIGAGTLRKYFDPNSQVYKDIIETPLFAQSYASYAFDDSVTGVHDFYRYSDDLFSARVTLKLDITRKNGTVKTLEMNTTYFFTKSPSTGKYMVDQISNVHVQELVEQVRWTFLNGEQKMGVIFVAADAQTITLPQITVPEGQVFRGWAQQTTDANGNITMTILFAPDANGQAAIPENLEMDPMSLYAVFEKEGATAQ